MTSLDCSGSLVKATNESTDGGPLVGFQDQTTAATVPGSTVNFTPPRSDPAGARAVTHSSGALPRLCTHSVSPAMSCGRQNPPGCSTSMDPGSLMGSGGTMGPAGEAGLSEPQLTAEKRTTAVSRVVRKCLASREGR